MLIAHMAAVEGQLLSISRIPANAGHTLHRGTPREAFIRDFLRGHLSARASIGTGEIIDAASQPREARNQFDIVVYKGDYPRIDLGGGVNAFLAEAVIATIEVKSVLTKEELAAAVTSAARAKRLQRHLSTSFTSGYLPPGILSYVVAYDGPAHIATVFDWLMAIEAEQGLNTSALPPSGTARATLMSESIDAIHVLGMGSIVFDNGITGVITDENRRFYPSARYQFFESADGNLIWLFLALTNATSNVAGQWPDLNPYLSRAEFSVQFGPKS